MIVRVVKDEYRFWWGLILVIIASILGSNPNPYLAISIILGFTLLISKPYYIVGPLFYMTVFDDFLTAFEGQSYSRYLVIILLISTTFNALLKREKRNMNGILLLEMVLLIVLGIITSLAGAYNYTSFPLVYVLNIVMAITMMLCKIEKGTDLFTHMSSYSIVIMLYSLYLVFLSNNTANISVDRILINGVSEINQYAIGIGASATLAFCLFLQNSKKSRLPLLIVLLIDLVCLFAVGSRTALIGVVLSSIFIYVMHCKRSQLRISRKFLVLASISMVFLVSYYYLSQKYPLLMNRFTISNITASGGTHRIEIWRAFFVNDFPEYWLLGLGFDNRNMVAATMRFVGISYGAHNIIVEILACTGIVGLLLYSSFYIRWFKKMSAVYRQDKRMIIPLGLFLCMILTGIGENTNTIRFLWFAIGLGFMVANSYKCENSRWLV